MKKQSLVFVFMAFMFSSLFSTACKPSAERKKLNIKLCFASFNGDLVQIKNLLAKGADPNTTECGEFAKVGYPTPLFFALLGYEKSAGDLIANKEIYDTPANDRQRLTVRALLAAGADPNTKSKTKLEETPLMYAEFLKSTSLIHVLTEAGADPNLRDMRGKLAKDYGEFTGEELKQAGSGHLVVRLAIAIAQKDLAEKEIVDEVVPKR